MTATNICIDTTRASAEAQLAERSNAAARRAGWYAATWDTTAKVKASLVGVHRPPRQSPVRDSVFAATSREWRFIRQILADHIARYPGATHHAVTNQCRTMEKLGMLEGRTKYDPETGGTTAKQYRRVEA